MKKIALLILLSAFTCAFTFGCGGDEPDTTPKSSSSGSQSGGGTTPTPSPDDPYINESSIECDVPNMIITFQGTPNKGFIEVLFRQLTNGNAERRMNVSRDNTKQLYYVKLTKLTGGSEYAFHVLAYNQYNQEVFRSAERRFTLYTDGLVTGACYLPHRRTLALIGYSLTVSPFVYIIDSFDGTRFDQGRHRRVALANPLGNQMEGIATLDGIHFFLTRETLSLRIHTRRASLFSLDLSGMPDEPNVR
jgi:hypothetical protein